MDCGTEATLLRCDYPSKHEVIIITIINIYKFNKYCLICNYCDDILNT